MNQSGAIAQTIVLAGAGGDLGDRIAKALVARSRGSRLGAVHRLR